jgi:hypothetical protein
MKPDFMICGAMKCGTTSLHYLLNKHPQICLPDSKKNYNELHFFDNASNFAKGTEWYENHFKSCKANQKIGQTSPMYIFHREAPKRIFEYSPNVKLIFILRDPVRRAYSHYFTKVNNGSESLSFERALEIESTRMNESALFYGNYSYFTRGLYANQIERYLTFFSKEQMFFLSTHDLNDDTQNTLQKLLQFLEVKALKLPMVHENVQKQYPRSLRLRLLFNRNGFVKKIPKIRGLERLLNKTDEKPEMDTSIENSLYKRYNESNKMIMDLTGLKLAPDDYLK